MNEKDKKIMGIGVINPVFHDLILRIIIKPKE